MDEVVGRLHRFIPNASGEQDRAWRDSVPPLQQESRSLLGRAPPATRYTSILEYQLPLESRRVDVILLANGAVIVFEMKGRNRPRQADIDQVAAYARDLRCYHRCCDSDAGEQVVHAVLVPMTARGYQGLEGGVHVTGPDGLADLIMQLGRPGAPLLSSESFLAPDAYRPLPTLVQAARELFHGGDLRPVHRARAFTDPAVDRIAGIIQDAAREKSRRLVLLTGVPGAGKTLVGLRIVHAHFLDSIVVARPEGRPVAPAVFLSGNGPLVQVLQYELSAAGGGGKAFVRDVRNFIKNYSGDSGRIPPEHVVVFDEAQRAWDVHQMQAKHGHGSPRSEPSQVIEIAERIPDWCVVLGLVGGGQEIHVGEEAGIGQWSEAVALSARPDQWTIHSPPQVATVLRGSGNLRLECHDELNLDREIRFHFAQHLHRFVGGLLDAAPAQELASIAKQLECDGFHLRATRSLDHAREYLKVRYADDPAARYGLLASSKDKDLERFGVPNGYQDTKIVKMGPWYSDAEDDPRGLSCRHLSTCVTEFGAQGLELDATIVAWGTDLRQSVGRWTTENARGHKRGAKVMDARQLRLNSYRVLLTRGRDAVIAFVPPLPQLDETWTYLNSAGFRELK